MRYTFLRFLTVPIYTFLRFLIAHIYTFLRFIAVQIYTFLRFFASVTLKTYWWCYKTVIILWLYICLLQNLHIFVVGDMLAAHGLQVRSLKLAVDELAAIVLHDVCQLYQRQFRSRRHE